MSVLRYLGVPLIVIAAACNTDDRNAMSSHAICAQLAHTPVLFVHGSGLSASTWDKMILLLHASGGIPNAYMLAVDLSPNDGDNILAAEDQLTAGLQTLFRNVQMAHRSNSCSGAAPRKTAIVAHSMGAVSSRWLAAKLAPASVHQLITIAGANHGTRALCGHSGDGNRQMCRNTDDTFNQSGVLKLLNGTAAQPMDETPFGLGTDSAAESRIAPDDGRSIIYLTLRIEPDEWIVPADSALLDGAGGLKRGTFSRLPITETSVGNFLLHTAVRHDDLPSHPDVIAFVLQALDSANQPLTEN